MLKKDPTNSGHLILQTLKTSHQPVLIILIILRAVNFRQIKTNVPAVLGQLCCARSLSRISHHGMGTEKTPLTCLSRDEFTILCSLYILQVKHLDIG